MWVFHEWSAAKLRLEPLLENRLFATTFSRDWVRFATQENSAAPTACTNGLSLWWWPGKQEIAFWQLAKSSISLTSGCIIFWRITKAFRDDVHLWFDYTTLAMLASFNFRGFTEISSCLNNFSCKIDFNERQVDNCLLLLIIVWKG